MPTDLRPPATRRGASAASENGKIPHHAEATGLAARFRRQPVLNSLLLALCVAAIVLAVSAIGPSTQSSGASTRTATVKAGVVQSTVSGSGNVQSSSQLDLGFKTSGTVTHIYVKEGEQVSKGQPLATLDAKSTEASLQQAEATLKSAEANLAQLEENEGESTGSGSGGGGSTSNVSYGTYSTATTTTPAPATTAPSETQSTTTAPQTSTPTTSTTKKSSSASSGSQSTATQSSSSTTKQSAATREANLASARATVKGDQVSVESAEKAVQNTKLYAPQDGTIVSLSGEVGESVSATGTSKASTSTSSSSSTGSGASTGGASTSSQSSQSSSGGSSSFAVLSDLASMQLVVGLSESEIGQVHAGQIATETIEALSGRKVAAHVAKVAQLATSSSGAASYDVTFQLDQQASGLKVGMSATAEVVVKQAEGVNVSTSAIKGGSVTVIRGGKQVTQPVTTGLAGDSTTIVLSGLKAGETVLLPSVSTTGSSSSSSSSRLGRSVRSALSGGGFAGGGLAGGGGGLPSGGPPG
jgi:multidrug efflux pump subunit AcrA (membrane-fusion protein)